MNRIFEALASVLPILLVIAVVLILISLCWRKVPQDKAAVITGFTKRIITGKAGLVIPFFERIDIVSLENIPITFTTCLLYTSRCV